MKIVFMNYLSEYWLNLVEGLKRDFPDHEFITYKDVENTRKLFNIADVVLTGKISEEEITRAKKLKAIFVPWTGVNALPWEAVNKKRIKVANNHGNAPMVAERAFSLSLALLGRIPEYHNDLKQGIWHGFSVHGGESDNWVSLRGRRCSILGLGAIGMELVKLLEPFNCEITGFKRSIPEVLPEGVNQITDNLEKAVGKSEIVYLLLPLTEETRGIIDAKIIEKLKGKYLVNLSRGEIIDEEALYYGLKKGILAGAAIDVWYNYPSTQTPVTLPSSYPIHTLKNVVISPHVGSDTVESNERMADYTAENLRNYLSTGKLLHEVDPVKKY